jgi:hypothetical protein
MKYAVEMGSGAMIYIPSFIKTGSGIQMLMEGIHRQHGQYGDLISMLLFFQNKGSRLKILKYKILYQSVISRIILIIYVCDISDDTTCYIIHSILQLHILTYFYSTICFALIGHGQVVIH